MICTMAVGRSLREGGRIVGHGSRLGYLNVTPHYSQTMLRSPVTSVAIGTAKPSSRVVRLGRSTEVKLDPISRWVSSKVVT